MKISFGFNSNISFKSSRKFQLLPKMFPHKKAIERNNPKRYYFVLADLKKVDEFMTQNDPFHISRSFIQNNPNVIKELNNSLSLPGVKYVESPIIETSRGKIFQIGFTDGRHRFAVFRLKGFKKIMLTVDQETKETFEKIGAIFKASEIEKQN